MTTFTTEDLYECMDAYRLAEHVDMWGRDLIALNMKGGVPCILGAKMLRLQADRIAELEKQISELKYEKSSGVYDLAKTLTDEEIREFITLFPIVFTPMDLLGFARAILRKAQEK